MSREKKPLENKRTDGGSIGTIQEKYIERLNALSNLAKAKEIEERKKISKGYVWMRNSAIRTTKLVIPENKDKAIKEGYYEL
ncbi:hypothetical protein K5I29_04110 [Flavobacterium agricola]|uniref:Uncharacterized protein n=1 Tax=Flavobacterium agricola TaxID=2870839 RepID=A0ABY6M4I9_9FLAO|nr:hypothetical protein [Flavobacterium agricola]UYW02093.1 hypothetical protein K5I29_04110 [Flavobacterium agricola]